MSNRSQTKSAADPVEVLREYIAAKKMRQSSQRFEILEVFLNCEEHQTVEQLLEKVKARHPSVGCATLYRTLRLFCECEIARELRIDDGPSRYEHLYGHKHHDHLVCTSCGRLIEVVDPEIERLQERLSRAEGFLPVRHRMEIYGVCRQCAARRGRK